jgi:hypothetical protein
VIPVAINLDLTFPAFVAQFGLSVTPKAEVSFYANGYELAECGIAGDVHLQPVQSRQQIHLRLPEGR